MIVSVTTFSIKFFQDILAVDKGYEKRILKIVTFFNSPSESDRTDSLFFFLPRLRFMYIHSLRLGGGRENVSEELTADRLDSEGTHL